MALQLQGAKEAQVEREVNLLCEAAHDDFARAYMVERMLLVESLRGTKARDIPTPKNFKEAVNSEFADYWNEAIETEIKNLWNFDTWKWVPIPKNRKLVDTTWARGSQAAYRVRGQHRLHQPLEEPCVSQIVKTHRDPLPLRA